MFWGFSDVSSNSRGLRLVPGIEPLTVQSIDWIPSQVLYHLAPVMPLKQEIENLPHMRVIKFFTNKDFPNKVFPQTFSQYQNFFLISDFPQQNCFYLHILHMGVESFPNASSPNEGETCPAALRRGKFALRVWFGWV